MAGAVKAIVIFPLDKPVALAQIAGDTAFPQSNRSPVRQVLHSTITGTRNASPHISS